MQRISIVGLESFPLVKVGDDLAKMIVETAKRENARIDSGDIIVVAQKVVSKAEGRVTQLRNVKPSERTAEVAKITSRDPRLVELVLKEIKNIVKASQEILIVENKRGLICINSGIDKSNVSGKDSYALLPEDPDQSAEKIRSQILKLTGEKVAVIICDTYSRPFRKGQVEFVIGIAGINPFKDYRGQKDLFDYVLKVKNVAIVDEIACAAELLMGQGDEGIPVVIVKNVQRAEVNGVFSAEDLNISKEKDLFKGTL
jgi:coenzyme F420-0:L-glutamate ligase/coenzyme F420-1:gamma-L-glutamate ligase